MNSACGLFAVADGAGTTLFSGAWADVLVRHFLATPLLDADPFEAEWWVRLAQEQFKQEFPAQTNLAWNAQQKVQSEGSYATLATLRFSAQDATHVQAELLAIGDSCIFIHQPGQVLSFPLQQARDFEQAPICIPSKPGAFHRYFHHFQSMTLDLAPTDVVVIATDAVAKWIISAGNGSYASQGMALQAVVSQSAASWPGFIEACRARHEMLDDDCTALVIALLPNEAALGSTTEHSPQVRAQRKQDFLQALADENQERAALYYGSGADLRAEGVTISAQEFAHARAVADALREVLSLLRQVLNNPDVVSLMTTAWQKHAQLLYQEPCAATVRNTLARLGVPLAPPAPHIDTQETALLPTLPALPARIAPTLPEAMDDDGELLMTQTFDIQDIKRAIEAGQQGEK